MSVRNLLVLLLPDGSEGQLRRAVEERSDESLNVHVVAPTRVGPLEWLATDEDEARREADIRALAAEWTLGDQADVAGEAGDVDPELAVEDALRSFPADEILIVGGESEDGGLEASLRLREPFHRQVGLPRPAGRGHVDRTDLQHVRAAHAPERRARGSHVCETGP